MGRSPWIITAVYSHPQMQELDLPVFPSRLNKVKYPCLTMLQKIFNSIIFVLYYFFLYFQ